jgi:uncharacterized protein
MRAALFAAICWLSLPTVCLQAQAAVDLGPITERHEMIPMRDGQKLSAYLYFPPGNGPWPAVFEQRYADISGAGTRKAAAKLAEAGYVVAMVNFRGTHESEGTWVGYRALGWGELKDGYDTCEWLATQKWSTGGVGTFGSSQGGYAQNFLAVTQPPHLKCQYMVDTGLSLFQEGYRIGGVTRPKRFEAMDLICRNPVDNRKLVAEWFRHPHYDDYWKQEDCSLHFAEMNVPCFTIGSWFDFMNQGSIASFIGRQHQGGPNSRGQQQLLLGPWLHGRLNKTNKVGELVFPENATWPEYDHMVRWFDHFLKGKDNGVEREPAVRYYVMGATGEASAPGNVWRTAADWPPPHTPTPLFLQASGGLSWTAPTDTFSSSRYVSDPRHPMEIPGTAFPGAKDARPFEKQAEVRTFTTPPLEQAVEWTGRVRAELYVSSTADDTDFIVRLSDVYPDGRSILIMDYPRRARYREGFDHQALLHHGTAYKLEFDVGWVSQIFNKGHQIRVTIASTGAPLYEPNPQTGDAQTIEFPADAKVATNTIHHSLQWASRIVVPQVNGTTADSKSASKIRYVQSGASNPFSSAVIVDNATLVYTTQLFPTDDKGRIAAPGDAPSQLETLMHNLEMALGPAIGIDRTVKLNLYVAREELSELALNSVAARFSSASRPAVSLVVTSLPQPGALVALDAIAAGSILSIDPEKVRYLPAGSSRLYVSGQAEKGETLREATRKTLESLSATLQHCGGTKQTVVQLKCFLQPMASVAEVQEELSHYFGRIGVPPVSFVEWKMPGPIEIEAVAWGVPSKADAKEPLEFITPTGMTASPMYCRVVRINRGGTIFFSDISGKPQAAADEQLQTSFDTLQQLLGQTGSDLTHLVKATYYVTDDEAVKAHNAIRPKYYDASRPPAASKAIVASTGRPGVRYTMDMIAVPAK